MPATRRSTKGTDQASAGVGIQSVDSIVASFIEMYFRSGGGQEALERFSMQGQTPTEREDIRALCSLFLQFAELESPRQVN